jgi:hypothetical protein
MDPFSKYGQMKYRRISPVFPCEVGLLIIFHVLPDSATWNPVTMKIGLAVGIHPDYSAADTRRLAGQQGEAGMPASPRGFPGHGGWKCAPGGIIWISAGCTRESAPYGVAVREQRKPER